MPTSVKTFLSTMPGAPVLTGTPGAALAVLDACLVDGFGLTSLVSLSVAANVATATVATGHPFVANSVALVAGSGTAALNGEQRVSSVTSNTFSFPAPGVADQTAAGSITAKVAPLGWLKAFSGANKAAYRSNDPQATGCYLRVDDSNANNHRVRGYESMSSIDVGATGFPTLTEIADPGAYWPKSNTTDSTPHAWGIIGDGRAFYWIAQSGSSTYSGNGMFFGDYLAELSIDQYACGLISWQGDFNYYGSSGAIYGDIAIYDTSSAFELVSYPNYYSCVSSPRNFNGAPGVVHHTQTLYPLVYINNSAQGRLAWPDPISDAMRVAPVALGANRSVRGFLPGLRGILNYLAGRSDYHQFDIISGFDASLVGRKMMCIRTGYNYTNSDAIGMLSLIDVSGPWR